MTILRENWLEAKLGLDLRTHNSGFGFGAIYVGASGQEFKWRPIDIRLNLISDEIFVKNMKLQGFHWPDQVVDLIRIILGLIFVVLNSN